MTPDQEQWNARTDTARLARNETRLIPRRPKPEPKPGSRKPFKHASLLYSAIMEMRARMQNDLTGLQLALSAFPPYVSRGHGGRHRTRNRTIGGIMNRHESKPYPNPGRSEAARRVFQSRSPQERAYIRSIESEVMA
jgi:hypothetical protein